VTFIEKRRRTTEHKRDAMGTVHFQYKDYFKLNIKNKSKKGIYFTLLDIQPDNVVNLLIPDETEDAAAYFVPIGKSMEAPSGKEYYQIGRPAGVETLKLIVTDKPIDLRPISASKGTVNKGSNTPLERLFGQTFFNDDITTREGKTTNLSPGSVLIHTLNFIIDP
jgi:hypothetical protein